VSHDNEFDGLAAYETEYSLFTGLYLYNNQAAGISIDIGFNNNIVTDAIITGNGDIGLFVINSHNNLFSAIQIHDSHSHGVFLAEGAGGPGTAPSGNTFQHMMIVNSGNGADPASEGFCVDGFVGGAGFCINNPSAVDNLVPGVQFDGNLGGCIVEAVPGLVQAYGSICRQPEALRVFKER
jgi:hypothetical protein